METEDPTPEELDRASAEVQNAARASPQLGGVVDTLVSLRRALDAGDCTRLRADGNVLQMQMMGGDWPWDARRIVGRFVGQIERTLRETEGRGIL
jgi:hypothetical protein